LGDPEQNTRGGVVAACGTSLGDDWDKLERMDYESAAGNRCVACQGVALRLV
jgi:hypothetical protein